MIKPNRSAAPARVLTQTTSLVRPRIQTVDALRGAIIILMAIDHVRDFGFVRYGRARFLLLPAPSMGGMRKMFPPDYGYSLWVVFAVWIAVIVILYPVCGWFAQLKQRRRDWWLSYL
jgi:hypothetical protein